MVQQGPSERSASFRSARFTLERRLGAGSVGVVYLAYDHVRKGPVALKTLRTIAPLPLFRFKQEFRALTDVVHPNLVRLYELICEDGHWFFTMEAIRGVDFVTFCQRHPDRVRDAVVQLVRGVAALHAAGRLHRDIKPTNILVTPSGRVVLLDFGLVTDVGGFELGGRHRVCGSAGYMSPEQSAAAPLTVASDLYAVGSVLFEALTGALPFEGSVDDVLEAKRHADGPSPRTYGAVDPTLDRLATDLLKRTPEERPTAEIVLRRLRADTVDEARPERSRTPPPSAPVLAANEPTFVGRREPLARLAAAFERSATGPAVVVVRGASGIGKSALVTHFLAGLDATVLTGRCYERESVPFKAIDPLVDALCHHLMLQRDDGLDDALSPETAALAAVFPVLRRCPRIEAAIDGVPCPEDPRQLRRDAFVALRALLAATAAERPLVLYVEDAQWADADSAAALASILRPPDAPRLLLVLCGREDARASSRAVARRFRSTAPDPVDALVSRLAPGPNGVETIDLDRLEDEDARSLALALLTDAHADSALRKAATIAKESRGHPLFVEELARHAVEEALVDGADLALDTVLARRLARLGADERRVLEVVALAAEPLPHAIALSAADVDARDPIPRLLNARWLRRAGTTAELVCTAHDRIRDHVVDALDDARRRALHRRLAAELGRDATTPPEAVAHHHREAGRADVAADLFVLGGRRAFRAYAFDHAAELFEAALALTPDDAGATGNLYRRLADALANAGRGADAGHAYLAAAERLGPRDALTCRRCAAEQLLRAGHVDEGVALLEEVLTTIDVPPPRRDLGAIVSLVKRRSRLLLRGTSYTERDVRAVPKQRRMALDVMWAGALGLALVDVVRAYDYSTAHLLAALDTGEPYRVARALAGEALNSATGGSKTSGRTRRLLREAERIATRIDHPHAKGLVHMTAGMSQSLVGRWRASLEPYDRATALFERRCSGVAWERDTVEHMRLWAHAYLGDLEAMRARIDRLLHDAKERGDRYATSLFSSGLANLVWLAEDDPRTALERVVEGMRPWSRRGFHLQHYNQLLAAAHVDLYAGRAERAHDQLVATWPHLVKSQLLSVQQIRIEAWHLFGRVALAASDRAVDPGPLYRQAARAARRVAREKVPWGRPLATLLTAGIAERRGDTDAAYAGYAEATQRLVDADMAIYANAARRRLGALVGDHRTRDADAWFVAAGVHKPAAFAGIFVP